MPEASPRTPINIREKYRLFEDFWKPRVVAELNDYQVKLAKVEGDFVWHSHADTDELFLVMEGSLVLEFRDGAMRLEEGEMYVVPKGVEHRPRAARPCSILLIEPRGVRNTGDAGGERTAANDVWI